MSITIRDTNNTERLLRALNKIGGTNIKVGLFGGGDIVMIGAVHEYGVDINVTPKMRAWFAYQGYPLKKDTTVIHIPERSFLRSGFDENIEEITRKVESLLPNVLEDGISADAFMDMVGLEFAGLIQKKLRDLRDPANSSMTTERKGSTNPLIDTGRLVGAISHKVE